MIECKICGKICKNDLSLAMHVVRAHNMTTEQYVKEYTELNKNCKLCGQPSRFMGIVKGFAPLCEHCGRVKSLEAFQILYGKEEGEVRFKHYKETSNCSLENQIRKYGKEKAEKIRDERSKRQSYINSKEGFLERYGKEEGTRRWEENKFKRNFSLDACIKKWGKEEGIKRHKEHCSKCGSTPDKMIKKYGAELGLKKYLEKMENQKRAYNKECLIEKYGEREGLKRYNRFLHSRYNRWLKGSKESLQIFIPLEERIHEYFTDIKYSDIFVGDEDRYEKIFYYGDGFYSVDFCIPKFRIIIEYNGIAFHPHPKWLKSNIERWNNWKCLFSNVSQEDIFKHDKKKVQYLKSIVFKILTLWSDADLSYNIEKSWRFVYDQVKRYY